MNEYTPKNLFKEFKSIECTYDEVANTYDVDLLQICQPNEDMLIVDGNIKNIFNHVDVLQFYQTDKITNSHNFPKSITHFNIYACCNFEYFDGKDCKFSDSKIFNKSHGFQHDNRLEISSCSNIKYIKNVNTIDQLKTMLSCCAKLESVSIKTTHDNRLQSLRIIDCPSITSFKNIDISYVGVGDIRDSGITSFTHCDTTQFYHLTLHCSFFKDFRNIKNLKVRSVLTLSGIYHVVNILELLHNNVETLEVTDSNTIIKVILDKYMNFEKTKIPLHYRSEYIMDCAIDFIENGFEDVS